MAGEVLFVDGSGQAVGRCAVTRRTRRGRDFRHAEVKNLGVTALGDEDVGGFDVAVNNTC